MRVIAIENEYLGLYSLTRTIKRIYPSGTEVIGFKEASEVLQYTATTAE